MSDVFVSYRHSDEHHVAPVADGLARRGLDVWFDRTDIRAGDRWRDEIAQGIEEALSVVVAIGPSGIDGIQAYEVDRALDRAVDDHDFRIIPLLLPGAAQEGKHWQQLKARSYLAFDGVLTAEIVDDIANAVLGLDVDGLLTGTEPSREPYPGLRSFGSDEADLFFGRTADVDRLLELCQPPGLTAVVGPSGVGKSSVVRAGLLPLLVASPLGEVRAWQIATMTPGHEPSRSALVALTTIGSSEPVIPASLVESCASDQSVLATQTLFALQRLAEGTGIVLFVDQLEELFTTCTDIGVRRAFADNLAHLVEQCPDRVRVVVTLRSDFLSDLLGHPRLSRLVSAQTHLLGPLGEKGLFHAIQEPARACNADVEATLVDQIVLDVRDQPNALRLLAVALQKMWLGRQGNRLTLRAYADGGRISGAIDELAERAVAPFIPDHEAVVRSAMLRLVHLSPASPPARRRRQLDELFVVGVDRPTVTGLVAALVRERLLVAGPAPRGEDEDRLEAAGPAAVELAHDAVITSWRRFADWVKAARGGDEEVRQRVEEATANWLDQQRSTHHLATPGLLANVAPLVDQGRLLLTPTEHEFLAESERAAARGRRRRWLVLATAGVAAVALGATALLVRQNTNQRRENRNAFATKLAAQSGREVDDRPDLGIRLATMAFAGSDLPETRSALLATLTQPAQMLDAWAPPIDDVLTAATTVTNSDQVLVGTATGDLWRCDARSERCSELRSSDARSSVLMILGAPTGAMAAVFENGTLVAAAPGGGTLQLIPTSARTVVAALDHNGTLVAVGTHDGAIELRDLAGASRVIGQVDGRPTAVAVSAASLRVVAASTGTPGFTLWDTNGTQLADTSAVAGIDFVQAATFDATGERLIVTDSTGDVLLYDVQALSEGVDADPVRLVGHDQPVVSLHVDDERLVSVDEAGEVRSWDLATERPSAPAMRAASPIGEPVRRMLSAGVSSDGTRVIGVRSDAIVEWDAMGRPAVPHEVLEQDDIAAIAVDPATDATIAVTHTAMILTMAKDGSVASTVPSVLSQVTAIGALGGNQLVVGGTGVAVINADDGVVQARRDDLEITDIAVPTAVTDRIVVATTDGTVIVLSTSDLSTYAGPFEVADATTTDTTTTTDATTTDTTTTDGTAAGATVTDVAVSADGTTIAAGRLGATVRSVAVIDVDSGERRELAGHVAEVSSIAFSPDGDVLASGSDDRTIIMWSTADWEQIGVLTGHSDRVRGLAFDAGGEMLLSASDDGTLRWWDVEERTPIGLPIRWNGDRVQDVRAGTGIAATLHGGTVVAWSTDPAQWVAGACSVSDRPLTATELSTFADSRTLPTTCSGSGS